MKDIITCVMFLVSRGYKIDDDEVIHKPNKDHVVTQKELQYIEFLIDTWGYGYEHSDDRQIKGN